MDGELLALPFSPYQLRIKQPEKKIYSQQIIVPFFFRGTLLLFRDIKGLMWRKTKL